MSARALVFGGTGMLGRAVVEAGRLRRLPVLGLSHRDAEITDRARVRYWIDAFRPEVIFNCAAYTKVDDCEHNPATAHAINELGALVVAEAAAQAKVRLVHVSTDYVFDGTSAEPYAESAGTGPLSVYGESKLAGEKRVLRHDGALVVRTSWLFGPGGTNFVATIRRLLAKGEPLSVVEDQVGCPTYTPFLAKALWQLAERGTTGVVHYRNRDSISWHGFACEIGRATAPKVEVRAIRTEQFPRPARRPAYSVLDVGRFEAETGRAVEPWLWGLSDYLDRMAFESKARGGAS